MSLFGNAPLSTAYGAVTGGTIDEESAQKMANTGATAASEYATKQAIIVKKYIAESNWTWKLAGMASGCLMIGTSVFGFLSSLFGLSPFMACLNLYILSFGIMSVCLEYSDQVFMKKYVDVIRKEAHFLITPSGRAAFYFFVGVLMVSKGGLLDLFAGLFLILVGVIIYNSCRNAFLIFNELHNAKYTEKFIVQKFREFDTDKSGQLESKELGLLCTSLGITLNRTELETALYVLDKDGSGCISEQEFVEWWRGSSPSLSLAYGM